MTNENPSAWTCRHELVLLAAAAPLLLFPNGYTPWAGLAVVALTWLARWRASGRLTVRTPLDLPILLLLGLILMAVAISPAPELSWGRAWIIVYGVAVYYALVNWIQDARRIRQAVLLLGFLTLSVALVSLVGTDWSSVRILDAPWLYDRLPALVTGIPGSGAGSANELFHPRWVGITLGFCLPLFFGLLMFGKDRTLQWLSAAVIGVGASVLLLTQSLQGLAALGIGLLVLICWRWRWSLLILPVAALGLCLAVMAFGPQRLAASLLSFDNRLGIGIGLRMDIWSRALAMLHDLPYTGIGLNAFPVVQANFYPGFSLGLEPHAHNLYLQTALDFGLVGLFAFAWLSAAWFFTVGRNYRSADPVDRLLLVGFSASLAAYLAHGLVDALMLGAKPSVAVWAILALGVAVPSKSQQTASATQAGPKSSNASQRPDSRRRTLPGWLPLAVLVVCLAASFAVVPAAWPMNLGALRAHRLLVNDGSRLAGQASQVERINLLLNRALAADSRRIFAYELLGRLSGWSADAPAGVEALRQRVDLESALPHPFRRYFPSGYLLTNLDNSSSDRQTPAMQPAPLDELLAVYQNWQTRYPLQAEHYVKTSLVWSGRKGDPTQARRVLEAGLAAGAEPAALLHAAFDRLR